MESLNKLLKNWPDNKVLMTIFPHPDDETLATGGLLLVARRLGWQTVAVVLTKGEAGRIFVKGIKEPLARAREKELRKAAGYLKISDLVMLDLGDRKLKEKKTETEIEIEKLFDKYRPGIVVTYDRTGISGHPDHIASCLIVKKILLKKLKEGQKIPLLLWVSLPKNYLTAHILKKFSQPTHVLNFGWYWFRKYRAAKAHRSQKVGRNYPLPYWLVLLLLRREWYHQVDLIAAKTPVHAKAI
ncbi:MAG: Mycothiol S-conjugate amidase [Microgenomates group bacterium ADurb.Bin219]|nr:MAG: Mycothiol S-conjugate amidase [Microgenomates group bacterium ADurb.Bin219]HNP89322.1 PIG-L family deacetylase [Candidatus Woesebacteria bacterium]